MMFKLLLICIFVVSIDCIGVTYKDVILQEWDEFKLFFAKKYKSAEEDAFRMKVFMENKHKIAKHNKATANGFKSYGLKMNEFGDLLHHEFVKIMNGYRKELRKFDLNGTTYLSPMNVVLPKSVDWRKEGFVTPVKNQGQCGSCWSFSSTGSLEGQHFKKTTRLVSLSEQNLIDCSRKFGNNGCEGGLMDNAFRYIKHNKGIDTEETYPYQGEDLNCRFRRYDVGAYDSGFVDVPADERKLQEAVATIGPISVAIDASHESFQFYSHGIYKEEDCSPENLDHGVLVVGYGVEDIDGEYWIVKNSWGESWGDQGYIKMARNFSNMCGIASQASYPLV